MTIRQRFAQKSLDRFGTSECQGPAQQMLTRTRVRLPLTTQSASNCFQQFFRISRALDLYVGCLNLIEVLLSQRHGQSSDVLSKRYSADQKAHL
jgi:hypothetical protein